MLSFFGGMVRREKMVITIKIGMVMSFWIYFRGPKKGVWCPSRVKIFFDESLMKGFFRRHLGGNTDGC